MTSDVEIGTVDLGTQLSLRLDPTDRPLMERVRATIGVAPPTEPTTVATSRGGGQHVLWLGPDEWLVVAEEAGPEVSEVTVRRAVGDTVASVVDVSANRVAIEIRGPAVRELLAFGCPLDLDPPVFGPGRCVGTLVARAQAIVWQLDATPTFRLLVRPSFAAYLRGWLDDALDGLA